MNESVAVVGAGVKAPGGTNPEFLFESLCAARSIAEDFHDPRLPSSLLVARVHDFEASDYLSATELRRYDRAQQLAIAAAEDALAGVELPPRERCAIVCGVGMSAPAFTDEQYGNLHGPGLRAMSPLTIPLIMPSSTAALLALRFGFRGPSLTVSAACASGAVAIGEAVEMLRRGAADLVLAGGVDAMVSIGPLAGFLRLDAMTRNYDDPEHASRPFDADRDGFLMGEGAGFVVLQRTASARLGTVVGFGSSSDAHHLLAPAPDGEGARRCMQTALSDAGLAVQDINHINAHGTSTLQGDLAEALAIAAMFGEAPPPVTAVKGTTGHLIGGSGAIEAIVALLSLRAGRIPPVAGLQNVDPAMQIDVVHTSPRDLPAGFALSNSFGFGGVNASLVLGA